MATKNVRKTDSKRNYARPTTPSTSSLSASTSAIAVDYSFTPSTLGPAATSYVITGVSNDGGASTSAVVTATSGTVSVFSEGKTYSLNLAAQNYNGLGAATGNTTVVVPTGYGLVETANATTSYVIPGGITKIAGIVVSTGGAGAIGGMRNNSNESGAGGGGGGSGALVGFWDFAVTSGNTVTLTVGSANAATKVTYGGVDIATANAGGPGNAGSNNTYQTQGNGGSGGNASTNIATNSITVNGNAGGAGGPGVITVTGTAGTPPTAGNTPTSVSTTSFNFAPVSSVTVTLGSGGGGGGGGRWQDSGNNNSLGQTGGTGGTNAGAGGTGSGNTNGNAGGAANNIGSGGGGGGGKGVRNDGGPFNPTNGGAGAAARIYLYTKP
jgi:hypothetical protein